MRTARANRSSARFTHWVCASCAPRRVRSASSRRSRCSIRPISKPSWPNSSPPPIAGVHAPRSGASASGKMHWSRRRTALSSAADEDEDLRAATRLCELRRVAGGLPGRRFRRPDRAAGAACSIATRTAAARWQQKFTHVLVDEYQDTNAAQYRLLRHLVGERTPFTVVGDDDQAIYGWRGATLENLALLPTEYPDLDGDQAHAELPVDGAHPA